jgi:TrmH family RNA methyltransferase
MLITSVHNPRVKEASKLRDRRDRQRQGRLLIDGIRELHRAVEAGVELVELFFCPERCSGEEAYAVLAQAGQLGTRAPAVYTVTPAVLEKLAYGERAEGLLGVARLPQRSLRDLSLPPTGLVLVLEQVEKPGNVGAVLRTADAVGAAAVIVCGGTDLFNPNVIRASLGTIFTVPVCSADSESTKAWLLQSNARLFTARVDGAVDYTTVDLTGLVALVFGAESQGLSERWLGPQVTPIRLPMLGRADSLNVSVAAAVMSYESLRQRQIAITAGG